MLVYRITAKEFSHNLYAPGISGRWNGIGRKVIYAAESIPLAFMENMIRRKGTGFNDHFTTMIIDIPDSLGVSEINMEDLEDGWRDYRDYSQCQMAGNKWYDACRTPVLKVPSEVIPECSNYVINTTHPEFSRINLNSVIPIIPDERIEDISKGL